MFKLRGQAWSLVAVAILLGIAAPAKATNDQDLYADVGGVTSAPPGWRQFCEDYRNECKGGSTESRDVVLSQRAWRDLVKVNRWVDETVKPVTDQEHWGVIDHWDLPTDGYGDCEDYALEKRHILVAAGWPRSALLMTVVLDKRGEGHAVLTVKTNKGEFILDNLTEKVVLWNQTDYRFVKRQSQDDQNVWVALGNSRPAVATASAEDH